ncbi:MAG: tyrosine-protein phosphatase [Raoultibacter sp.]|jgi:protein-tyrosine phosphatase
MRDIHCHILPGVDDGARDLEASLAMLDAAKRAGITSIVCTPHVRDPYFDYDAMREAYEVLRAHAGGFPLAMGWEVNHAKLMELGMEWAEQLCFEGTNEFLLELSSRCRAHDFEVYERTIFELQGMGYTVIIAHPERYLAIQEDVEIARDLVRMGCKLQASADFVAGGRLGREKKHAKKLFEENLYSYIASDAHCVDHYACFAEARETYRCRGAHARL